MQRSRTKRARQAAIAIAAALATVLIAAVLIATGCTAAPTGTPENQTGGSAEASAAAPGGATAEPPGPADEAAIKAAIQAYVLGESEIEPKDYSIGGLQMMNDNTGVAWAAAGITPKAKNLDSAAVVLKRGADGKWVGVELGTDLASSPLFPPEVSQQFFGPGE
jgi:hypothetical protein